MEIEAIVGEYVSKELLKQKSIVKSKDSLVNSGLLDSVTLLQLIAFVEERFGIVVDADEMKIDNFQNIEAIGSFIRGKQGAR